MDRTTRMDAAARTMRIDLPDSDRFIPASRQAMLDVCRGSLSAGPILVTGDAGSGKSWLVDRLIDQAGSSRWLTIDLTPNDAPGDFYRHLARSLGLTRSGPSRLDIADALAERAADGERNGLVIDEAQNLGLDVWEEVRVLLNRLGSDEGFAHLILVGQTPLIRRFTTRPMAAIEARLAAHVHVRPLDIAESRTWLSQRHPGLNWTDFEFEAIHRDTGGNPRRLIRRADQAGVRGEFARPEPMALEGDSGHHQHPAATERTATSVAAMNPPLTGPDRPPLHVAENSIEVGWSADDADAAEADTEAGFTDDLPSVRAVTVRQGQGVARSDDSDQAVHDHYAALQAWREWANNQEKRAEPDRSDRALADAIDEAAASEAADPAERVAADRGSLRAEGYQHFAPFGQLFTRMAPVREP